MDQGKLGSNYQSGGRAVVASNQNEPFAELLQVTTGAGVILPSSPPPAPSISSNGGQQNPGSGGVSKNLGIGGGSSMIGDIDFGSRDLLTHLDINSSTEINSSAAIKAPVSEGPRGGTRVDYAGRIPPAAVSNGTVKQPLSPSSDSSPRREVVMAGSGGVNGGGSGWQQQGSRDAPPSDDPAYANMWGAPTSASTGVWRESNVVTRGRGQGPSLEVLSDVPSWRESDVQLRDRRHGRQSDDGRDRRHGRESDDVEREERAASMDRAAGAALAASITATVERAMKRHADNQHLMLEEMRSRLEKVESVMERVEGGVVDIHRMSADNHGEADGRLRSLEHLVREILHSVQVMRDKQEIAEAHAELSKMQLVKVNSTNVEEGAASSVSQPSTIPQNSTGYNVNVEQSLPSYQQQQQQQHQLASNQQLVLQPPQQEQAQAQVQQQQQQQQQQQPPPSQQQQQQEQHPPGPSQAMTYPGPPPHSHQLQVLGHSSAPSLQPPVPVQQQQQLPLPPPPGMNSSAPPASHMQQAPVHPQSHGPPPPVLHPNTYGGPPPEGSQQHYLQTHQAQQHQQQSPSMPSPVHHTQGQYHLEARPDGPSQYTPHPPSGMYGAPPDVPPGSMLQQAYTPHNPSFNDASESVPSYLPASYHPVQRSQQPPQQQQQQQQPYDGSTSGRSQGGPVMRGPLPLPPTGQYGHSPARVSSIPFEPNAPAPSYSGPQNTAPSYSGPQYRVAQPLPSAPMGASGPYPRLQTAQPVSHQPPAAIPLGPSSGSAGGGAASLSTSRVPIDKVINDVAQMGFSKEDVRSIVKRLTENGQSVDLNIVLDKLMTEGIGSNSTNPKQGWFGR